MPVAILFDSTGTEIAVVDGASLPAGTRGLIFAGVDGSGNARFLLTSSAGRLSVDVNSLPTVTITATALDIRPLTSGTDSVAAVQSGNWDIRNITGTISLPTGAATEATLANVLTTAAFQARIPANGQALMAASVPVVIASNQSAVPISAASLPLPSGAATSAKQPALGTAGSASADVITVQGITSMTPLKVDGSGVTQPVSGTVSVSGNVDVTPASPAANDYLPVRLTDGSSFYSAGGGGGGGASQADKSTFTEGTTVFTPVGGVYNETPASDPTEDQAAAARITAKRAVHVNLRDASGAELGVSGAPVRVDPTGTTTQPISAASLPLPTGASTAAKQPALGTAGSASADVITVQGITSMTPLKVDGSGVTQPVSGTVTVTQSTAASLNATVVGTGTFAAQDSQVITDNAAFTDGTSKVFMSGYVFDDVAGTALTENDAAAARVDSKRAQMFVLEDATTRGQKATVSAAGALKVDGSAVTQPVSGTVTANIGTSGSLALDASVTGLQVSQGSATSGQKGGLTLGAVTSAAPTYTNAQTSPLSLTTAGALRVDGSAATQPVSGTVSIAANSSVNVNQIAGTTTSVNNGTADAGTIRVTLASNSTGQVTLAAGANTIGAVTQASGPWTQNLTQVGSTNVVTGGVAGLLAVGGNVANGGTATANPVPVGGVFQTAPTTLTNGQTATLQFTAAQNLKHDITTIAGTAPTTAGKLDVKGADGDVFVRQATAANLNATVVQATGTNLHVVTDATSTTAVTQATAANLNAQVVGAAASGAAKAGNPVQIGGVFNTTQPTVTTGQAVEAQATARGELLIAKGVSGFSIDNTSFGATQSGNWSVRAQDGAGNALTSNSTVTAGKFALDQNIISILGTAPTTAGKLDVKGADGDVFVRQTTAANLNAQVQGAAASGAAKAGNPVQIGGVFNTTQPTVTTGQAVEAQSTARGAQIVATGVDTFNVTVSAALPTGTNTLGSIKVTDGTTVATVRELGVNDALNVAIVDGSGNQITSFGGGTQYTEDAPAAADPTGTVPILVRADTPAAVTSANGDNIAQRATNYGAAYTQIVTSAGAFVDSFGGGTQYADGAARGTATGTIAMVDDGTNVQSMSGDTSGRPNMNARATSAGSFHPAPQFFHPSLDPTNNENVVSDSEGALFVRGPSYSDEGGYYDEFTGSSLQSNLTGTVTLTNGSTVVSGSGTLFTTELTLQSLIKANADSETSWARVVRIISDTSAVLDTNYAGTGGAGTANKARLATTTGSGGSITVSSSLVNVVSGTTSGSKTFVWRPIDYSPMALRWRGSVTQRVANQEFFVGLADSTAIASIQQQAAIVFSGTDNTKVTLRCWYSSAAADQSEVSYTLPSGTTATVHEYSMQIGSSGVTLMIDGQLIATQSHKYPDPYTQLNLIAGVNNTGAPATTGTLSIDNIYIANVDVTQISSVFQADKISIHDLDDVNYGTITAVNQTVSAQVNNEASSSIQVSGSWTGTLYFEATSDGTNWVKIHGAVADSSTIFTQISNGGISSGSIYRFSTGGYRQIRVRSVEWFGGTATITLVGAAATSGVFLNFPLPPGTNSIGTVVTDVPSSNNLNVIPLLQGILTELKILNTQINSGLSVSDDLDAMRNDAYFRGDDIGSV